MILNILVRSYRKLQSISRPAGPPESPITPYFAAQVPSLHSKVLSLNESDEGGRPVSCTLPKE